MASSSPPPLPSSRTGITRRSVNAGAPPPAVPIHPDIDPPPKTKPAFQLLALGLIVFFACLQFLPPTHFRDPADPLRKWIPADPNRSRAQADHAWDTNTKTANVHVVSWIDCLDLRVLAVLMNSTLQTSQLPEHIYFHFFVPDAEEEKLPYYKLKVLFPESNIEIIGKREIKEKTERYGPEIGGHVPFLPAIAPLIISKIRPYLTKFIFLQPCTIVKENINELFRIDLGHYDMAAVEDCTKKLGDYANIEIVNAIQRTASKTWVSKHPYDENNCIPDFNLFLINVNRLGNLFEAIRWWNKILNEKNDSKSLNASIALALYNKYLKLPTSWKLSKPKAPQEVAEAKFLHYDGPKRICSDQGTQHHKSGYGYIWQQYVSEKSEVILSH